MSDHGSRGGINQEPSEVMDEERLKRLCEVLGFRDAPIFREASEYDYPVDRVSATLVMLGARMVEDLLWTELERRHRKITELSLEIAELKRKRKRRGATARPAHRPRLRRTAEAPDPFSRGLGRGAWKPAEQGVGEIRLDYVEGVKADAEKPMKDREAVNLLIAMARNLPVTPNDPPSRQRLYQKIQKALLTGTPETILKSLSMARAERRRSTSD